LLPVTLLSLWSIVDSIVSAALVSGMLEGLVSSAGVTTAGDAGTTGDEDVTGADGGIGVSVVGA